MKTLFILRHAKSSWDDPKLDDHDRPLNGRGRKAAVTMGEFMQGRSMVPELVLASSARRAQQTVELWSKACGYLAPVETRPELYLAEPAQYVAALGALDHEPERVMVVGHNPGLEQLVEALTGNAERLPTAALTEVRLRITAWRDLEMDGTQQLVRVWQVKQLDDEQKKPR